MKARSFYCRCIDAEHVFLWTLDTCKHYLTLVKARVFVSDVLDQEVPVRIVYNNETCVHRVSASTYCEKLSVFFPDPSHLKNYEFHSLI